MNQLQNHQNGISSENAFDFHLFSFLGFNYDFIIHTACSHIEAWSTLMTSQIRSRIEYLITMFWTFLYTQIWWKSSLIGGFSIPFNGNSEVAYFLGHPVQCPLHKRAAQEKRSSAKVGLVCSTPDDVPRVFFVYYHIHGNLTLLTVTWQNCSAI